MKGLKVITFDGDGTLWDFKNAMRKSLSKIAEILKERFPEKAEKIDIDTLIRIRNEVAENTKGKFINLEEVRRRSFDETLRRLGIFTNEFSDYLSEVYFRERYRQVEIYEDTVPVIKELRKRYKVGIISNGNTYPEKIGLTRSLFDFMIYAETVGVSKPDPEIFHIAMERAGVSPQEMIHVGDSIEDDIIPATELGIKSFLIVREREKPDIKNSIPDNVPIIKNLHELKKLLFQI